MHNMKLIEILKGISRDPFNGEIYEGLIKTIPLNQAMDILDRQLQDYPELDLIDDPKSGEIIIGFKPQYLTSNISKYSGQTYDPKISKLLQLLNNLGYFPSIVKFELNNQLEQYSTKYSSKEFRKLIDEEEPTYLIFVFEPKYDQIITSPKYIYHVTDLKFLENIKSIGLKPKTLNKRASHPERIYFSLNDQANNILWGKMKYHIKNGILLTIDTTKLNNTFYNDPNFQDLGIYTYENIPPSSIVKYQNITK
jgi:hypothetical protein